MFDYDKTVAEYLAKPITRISEEHWNDMLNVLPPIAWKHVKGIERFNMSEFTIGTVTAQYVKARGRYYMLYVRHGDESTYYENRRQDNGR